MNVIRDNIAQIKKDFATNKPMTVKPTIIGNALMPPPSSAAHKFVTPSSSRSRAKDGFGSSTSNTKSSSTVHRESHVIASICEGRGKATGIVGIAAIDIHRPILILSQISDNKTYTATLTKLNILRPLEILVPNTFVDGATVSRLVTIIMKQFPNLSVTSISRSEFNQTRGIHIMKTLCAPVYNSVILQITHKFYAPAAACALLKYVEQSRRILYSPESIKIEYQEPEYTTGIDLDTAYLLELVSTSGKQTVSLFTVLNYCCTTPGKKLLRTNILQPPCRKNVIEIRLDCVQELLENASLLTRLQETLRPLSDIEASLTFGTVVPATASTVSERQLNYTLQLKGLLNAVQPLAEELKVTKHPVYREIYNRFEGLETRKKILDLISEVVNEDAHLAKGQAGELQRCFALKSGINGFLDLARRMYTEEVDNMRAYVDELSITCNLPLRVQHTIKNGFHITLPLTKALRNLKKTDLPPVFIKSERFSTHFYLNTMDMINFDKRLKNNSAEIQNISNVIIYKLLIDIRPYIGDLYQLCDDVAQLDMFVSLARASSVANWVRPRLVDTHLYLEGARHPVLEHIAHQDPVSNTIYAYPRSKLHIITGPNMSGKTILLHTICLIQVLAQMGCWVPCTLATVRIADKVYASVADDESALIGSSFALEAAKIAYLLNTLTNNSLVVLDELCKTTSCDEGVALAVAVCEKMLKTNAFVFVASHFMGVTKMADLYPNVLNWYMETLEEYRANNTRISLKFTYKYLPGVTSIDSYGIKLSRIFNSSKSISDRAAALHKYLEPMRKSLSSESASNKPEYLKHKLQAELDLLKIKNQLTDEIQKEKITNFEKKTGLSFQPSPITLETISNSMLLDQTSSNDNKTSTSAEKKLSSDSNNWIPTPSNKSTITSNHQFSIPTSVKTSSNLNQDNHIFSFDDEPKTCFPPDENYSFAKIDSFHSFDGDITFSAEDDLSSVHKNVSYLLNNDILPCTLSNNEIESPDITFQECSVSLDRNLFDNSNKKSKSIFSQETNWSSAENTFNNNLPRSTNLIVNSTPSTSKNLPLYYNQTRDIEVQSTPNPSQLRNGDQRFQNVSQSSFFQPNSSSNNFNITLRTDKTVKNPVPSRNTKFSFCQENSGHKTSSFSQESFAQELQNVSQSKNFQSNSNINLRPNEIVKTPMPSKNVTFHSYQVNSGHNLEKTSSFPQESFAEKLQNVSQLPKFQSNSSNINLRPNDILNTPVPLKNVTFNSYQENSGHNLQKTSSFSEENVSQSLNFQSNSSSNNFNISFGTNEIVKSHVPSKNAIFSLPHESFAQKHQNVSRSPNFQSNSSSNNFNINLRTNEIDKTSVPSKNDTFNSYHENSVQKLPKTSSFSRENVSQSPNFQSNSSSNNFNINLQTNEIDKTPVPSKNDTFNSYHENSVQKHPKTSSFSRENVSQSNFQSNSSSNNFNINLRTNRINNTSVSSKNNTFDFYQENSIQKLSMTSTFSRENVSQSPNFQSSNSSNNSNINLRPNRINNTPVSSKYNTFDSYQENSVQKLPKTSTFSRENVSQSPNFQSSNSSNNSNINLRPNRINNTPVSSKYNTFDSYQENSVQKLPKTSTFSREHISQSSNFQSNNSSNNVNTNLRTNEIARTPVSSKNDTFNSYQENSVHNLQKSSNSSIFESDQNSSLLYTKKLSTNTIPNTPLSETQLPKSQNIPHSPIIKLDESILSKKALIPSITPKKIAETITSSHPSQIQLVSNLYDSSSDSDNSDKNDDNNSNDSIIIIEDEENDFPDISSLDELNFETYLNLRQGITSTPIAKEKEKVENQDISLINDSTKYYTADSSITPPNTFIFHESNSSFESPIIKRKYTAVHKIVPKKIQKISTPCENSPNLFSDSSSKSCVNSTFKSCVNISDLSKCSTAVGQNKKVNPFCSNVSPVNINEQVFEQDTVLRQNSSENFSFTDFN